jgi:hypothetical protein
MLLNRSTNGGTVLSRIIARAASQLEKDAFFKG